MTRSLIMPFWPFPAGFREDKRHEQLAALLQIPLNDALWLAVGVWEYCRAQAGGTLEDADVYQVVTLVNKFHGYQLAQADALIALTAAKVLHRRKAGTLHLVGWARFAGKAARRAERIRAGNVARKRRERSRQKSEMSRTGHAPISKKRYGNVTRDCSVTVGKGSSSYQKKNHRDGRTPAGAPPPRDLEAIRARYPELKPLSLAELRKLSPDLAAEVDRAEALANPSLPLIGLVPRKPAAPEPADSTPPAKTEATA